MLTRHASFLRSAATSTSATHKPCTVLFTHLARNIVAKNLLARQIHALPPPGPSGPAYPSFRDSLHPPRPNTILGRIRYRKDGKPRSKSKIFLTLAICAFAWSVFQDWVETVETERRFQRYQEAAFRVDAKHYDSLNMDDIQALTAYIEKLEAACELEELGKILRRALVKMGKEELAHETMRLMVEDTHEAFCRILELPPAERTTVDWDSSPWNIVFLLILARYSELLLSKDSSVGDPDSCLWDNFPQKDGAEAVQLIKEVPPELFHVALAMGNRKRKDFN